jgi:hypothetical protein
MVPKIGRNWASGVLQLAIVGNSGAKFEAAQSAAARANVLVEADVYDSKFAKDHER